MPLQVWPVDSASLLSSKPRERTQMETRHLEACIVTGRIILGLLRLIVKEKMGPVYCISFNFNFFGNPFLLYFIKIWVPLEIRSTGLQSLKLWPCPPPGFVLQSSHSLLWAAAILAHSHPPSSHVELGKCCYLCLECFLPASPHPGFNSCLSCRSQLTHQFPKEVFFLFLSRLASYGLSLPLVLLLHSALQKRRQIINCIICCL